MTVESLVLSTDRSLVDLDAVHGFLSTCYWSPGIARERVARAIEHSLCIGVYDPSSPRPDGRPGQAAFARVVTDCASFAYLCDVFVMEAYRGQGLSKRMMSALVAEPALDGIRRFCLLTRDAHGLYRQFGFGPISDPTRYMERLDTQGYRRP